MSISSGCFQQLVRFFSRQTVASNSCLTCSDPESETRVDVLVEDHAPKNVQMSIYKRLKFLMVFLRVSPTTYITIFRHQFPNPQTWTSYSSILNDVHMEEEDRTNKYFGNNEWFIPFIKPLVILPLHKELLFTYGKHNFILIPEV